MTVNLIETLKTSIHSPKHTKNTKTPFKQIKFFKNLKQILSKNKN